MATINRLTARGAAALTEPGRHADGANLYLAITKTGARSWVFLYRFGGKQKEMGLGSAGPGGVSLADARDAAADARRLVAQGIDPLVARAEAKAEAKAAQAAKMTFGDYAATFIALHEGEWRNEKHVAQWRMTILGPQPQAAGKRPRKLAPDYCGGLRKRPLAEVSTEDVLDVIRPLWADKRETANRIRQRIEAILDAARVEGRRQGENPARWQGHLSLILPQHGKKSKGHYAAMPWRDVPGFVQALRDRDGVSARALEFAILTACRSGEVRGAAWGEFDLATRVWTVPASRMKAGREHRVPLTARAVEIVEAMLPLRPRTGGGAALVFPGTKGMFSDMTLSAVLRRMEIYNATVHGFRSAFRDWAAETTAAPFEVMEAALAHSVGDGTVAAYFRSDLFEKRRALMDAWSQFLATEPATESRVIPMRRVSG